MGLGGQNGIIEFPVHRLYLMLIQRYPGYARLLYKVQAGLSKWLVCSLVLSMMRSIRQIILCRNHIEDEISEYLHIPLKHDVYLWSIRGRLIPK
jgi:hypothetical protein